LLAWFDWRAYALSDDGKNRHTLTAKNQIELEEKVIISDRRYCSQLRSIFAFTTSHRARPTHPRRLPVAPSAFQFCEDIEAITIPDDSKNIWFAANLTILDIGLFSAG
jgi:hypothetical protein